MPDQAAKALRFTHLRLKNWRNFVSLSVPLAQRVFLVGPNASGKSNLLDVFRFVHDLVAVGGGLEEAVAGSRRGGVKRLRSLAARQQSDLVVHVMIGTGEEPHLWEYELQFSHGKGPGALVRTERVARAGEEILCRPDAEDCEDPERLTQTHLEQTNVNRAFRPIAEFFRSVRYLHVVPQLVRDAERFAGRTGDPYGGDFLERIARTPEKTRTLWLRQIQSALRAAVPQLKDLEFYRDQARGASHLRSRYEHWRPRGAWQDEDQFSDGTLRLIGLLWAVLEGSGPLLLEEPELPLHPDLVGRLAASRSMKSCC